jgi:hypothetical protein
MSWSPSAGPRGKEEFMKNKKLRHTCTREAKCAKKAEGNLYESLAALRTALNYSSYETIQAKHELEWARSILHKLEKLISE